MGLVFKPLIGAHILKQSGAFSVARLAADDLFVLVVFLIVGLMCCV